MTPHYIVRRTAAHSVTIANGASASNALDIREFASGMIRLPSAMTGTAFAIHGCDTVDGTFVAIEGTDGNALAMTFAVSTWMTVPEAVFGASYIKFVSNGTEGAARSLTLMLKT
jgi:hypothetical protein